jgi:molybdopterin converting factor small subunit
VNFSSDLQRYTGGVAAVEVSALNYQELLGELSRRFPGLTGETLRKLALAVDGRVIHTPLLETFDADSELIFVPRIAGG